MQSPLMNTQIAADCIRFTVPGQVHVRDIRTRYMVSLQNQEPLESNVGFYTEGVDKLVGNERPKSPGS